MLRKKGPTQHLLRRVYATVDEKTFANFRERSYAEGLTIGDSLAALVNAYASGYELQNNRNNKLADHVPKREANGIDYRKEHN
jgi:hypothetical protein